MSETESENAITGLTQLTYKGTEYSDQSWEVIGEPPSSEIFVPIEIEVLAGDAMQIDPMFADYGGRMESNPNETRWQLPDAIGKQRAGIVEEEEVISYSEDEVKQMVAEAEAAGRVKALEEAIEIQNQKLAKIEQSMNVILNDMQQQFSEKIAETEKYALELSISIADKLLHHTVEVNPEYISNIINEAIGLCGSANINKIRVSPQDMEFIQIVGIEKNVIQKDKNMKFESDSSIRAGCVIETTAGEVDYQLDKAFERIQDNILKVKK